MLLRLHVDHQLEFGLTVQEIIERSGDRGAGLDNHSCERSVAASARPTKKAAARAAFFLVLSKGITGRDVAGRLTP